PNFGGGGGGRPNMAQAGGKNPAGLKDAIAKVLQEVEEKQNELSSFDISSKIKKNRRNFIMSSLDKTMHFDFNQNKGKNVYDTLQDVCNALEEKGYSPINQIVGYLLSGDPAYIPRHNDARNLIW